MTHLRNIVAVVIVVAAMNISIAVSQVGSAKKYEFVVRDASTAKAIGEAVLLQEVGRNGLKSEMPLTANQVGDYWYVYRKEKPGDARRRGGLIVVVASRGGCVVDLRATM